MSPDNDPFEDLASDDEEFEAPLDQVNEGEPEYGEIYQAACVAVVKNVGKQSGMPKFQFTFRIIKDEKGKDTECEGWEGDVHCSLGRSALWKLTEVLEALHLGKAGEKVTFKRTEAVGRVVKVAIEKNEFNGREKAAIGAVASTGKKNHRVELDKNTPF